MNLSLTTNSKLRIIHDTIHGTINLHPLVRLIIDTPEFQRLRDIRQNGNAHFVYMGMKHTRFEHCIGVSYLAGEFIRKLKIKFPEVDISYEDILMLEVAGLCHDIGHCAFSHLFDNDFLNKITEHHYQHEHYSYFILQAIYQRHKSQFKEYGLDDDAIKTIGKMILGGPDSRLPELEWTEDDNRRLFMFEILSNHRLCVDVDKFDYIRRDCYYSNLHCTFDAERLMKFAMIVQIDGRHQIEYHHKGGQEMIAEMWISRDRLHRKIYQHRVVKCIDNMVLEILMSSLDLFIPSIYDETQGCKLRDIHTRENLGSYLNLTDNILTVIQYQSEAFNRSKQIIRMIKNRQLWKTVCIVKTLNRIEDFKGSDSRLGCFSDQDGARLFYSEVTLSLPAPNGSFIREYTYYFFTDQDDQVARYESMLRERLPDDCQYIDRSGGTTQP